MLADGRLSSNFCHVYNTWPTAYVTWALNFCMLPCNSSNLGLPDSILYILHRKYTTMHYTAFRYILFWQAKAAQPLLSSLFVLETCLWKIATLFSSPPTVHRSCEVIDIPYWRHISPFRGCNTQRPDKPFSTLPAASPVIATAGNSWPFMLKNRRRNCMPGRSRPRPDEETRSADQSSVHMHVTPGIFNCTA